ncbi:hypothetical protein Q5P01_000692 [Channa striata]|uniref:non-specific serine/threonine protein kinase n=1 Tax=Channa striata TaxID=64152 RepID=A0AA88IIH1_CHASR|nr:hypothetical protein Q5P01_000692 [Channa striata]
MGPGRILPNFERAEMDMMEFMDLVYDGEKLSAMVEHGMAPTAVLRAQIHGLVALEQLNDAACHNKGRLSEDTARNFLRQILEAVRHCHSRGVIHMDLKEENILVDLDTEKLKLIDFARRIPSGDDVHSEFYGTKAYGPPERISSRGLFRARPAEVWSLGILLYSMVHGNVPFEENSEIVRGRLRFKTGLSDTCRDLILRCLRQNPDERPSVEQIFSHPWVTETKVSDTAVARDNKVTAASSSPEDLGELGVHGGGPGERGRGTGRGPDRTIVPLSESDGGGPLNGEAEKTLFAAMPEGRDVRGLDASVATSTILWKKRLSYVRDSCQNVARPHYVAHELRGLGMISQEELDAIAVYSAADKTRALVDRAVAKGNAVSAAFMEAWARWNPEGDRGDGVGREGNGKGMSLGAEQAGVPLCPQCGHGPDVAVRRANERGREESEVRRGREEGEVDRTTSRATCPSRRSWRTSTS